MSVPSVIIVSMSHTLVAFNAHPDDEALLEAGTLAEAAARGHRVVLVVATDGDQGMTSQSYRDSDGRTLGERRLNELRSSAASLGVSEVIHLGYADSGMTGDLPPDPPGRERFLRADPQDVVDRLVEILQAEQAQVLLGYDANGGYGHRDHVRVHEVARRAALIAGTPRLLEATVPRELIARTVELVGKVYRYPSDFDPAAFRRSYSPREEITFRIDVRRQIAAKRASMAAHASQAAADAGADRTLAAFLRLPAPVYALAFGREWFADASGLAPGEPIARRRPYRYPTFRTSAGTLERDVFAGL
ncbi:PIG-L deacetylase family protein [Austwickia chelonae]|uniref:PIG-L deacetylase family protein n=1 Tax=Austwickia chelonae TaxID=100225 RepID=UPI001F080B62|nr:PIG-L family deacetylase [Austwickia chelonae]